MMCNHRKEDGTCLKSHTDFAANRLKFGKSMKCSYDGDVQQCLDGLIELNEHETLWKDYVASCIILREEEAARTA